MSTLLVSPLRRKSVWLLPPVAVLACDSFKEDFIEPENQFTFSQTEFYILPTSSTVIDLKSLIKYSSVRTSLGISENPTNGTLTKMTATTFKHTPNANFPSGQDRFVISYFAGDGTIIMSEMMTINVKNSEREFPCRVYAVEDEFRFKHNKVPS